MRPPNHPPGPCRGAAATLCSLWDSIASNGGRLGYTERSRRAAMIVFCFFAVFAGAVSLQDGAATALPLLTASGVVLLCAFTPPLLKLLLGGTLSDQHLCILLGFAYIAVVLNDLAHRSKSAPLIIWPFFVLVTDVALVLGLSRTASTTFVACVGVYLLLSHAETCFRFGLLDLPGTAPQSLRREMADSLFQACDDIPCGQPVLPTATNALMTVCVFLFDFIITRRFADQVCHEKKLLQGTIDTLHQITTLLAAYKLDAAEEIISEAQGQALDMQVRASLHTLLDILRTYRSYMPHDLFDEEPADVACVRQVSPPGLDAGKAAIVFTDIRASTALWHTAPEAMKKAIKVHNITIRSAIAEHGGYEVKTVGDAFMVAFHNAAEALAFSLVVQESLLAAPWPPGLLEVEFCAPSALWGGLTVRIGVNSGEVSTERDEVTGRIDYFGHTVNLASRMEAACEPGAVALPLALWEEEGLACPAVTSSVVSVSVKGLPGLFNMVLVWPASLRQRQHQPFDRRVMAASPQVGMTVQSHLRSIVVTMGVVMMDDSAMLGTMLQRTMKVIFGAAEKASGTVVTLLGSCAAVGWNMGKVNEAHAENSLRFANLVRASASDGVHIGICTGSVNYGDVGTLQQRFVTAVGMPARCAWNLSEMANRQDRFCLYTSTRPVPAALYELLSPSLSHPDVAMSGLYELNSPEAEVVENFSVPQRDLVAELSGSGVLAFAI